MDKTTLIIGNKNYSSWSLRAWMMLKQSNIEFDEILLKLDTEDFEQRIGDFSPSRTVPVLNHGGHVIWDSLAIAEYLNETYPNKQLWPQDVEARISARAVSAEMHSAFFSLRKLMPMNCRAENRRVEMTDDLLQNIERVKTIWTKARKQFGNNNSDSNGGFLFGHFTIADAMYAPVVFRFNTYGVELDGPAKEYADHMLQLTSMQDWLKEAKAEPEFIAHEEVGNN